MRHRNNHSGTATDHARYHINLRLERWHRFCIYAAAAELAITGIAWLIFHFFLRPVGEFGESVHPLEPWMMKLHGAGVMVTLFFLGSLMNSHIRRALKAGRNLWSGWAMIVSLSALIVSGYALYYVAGETDRPAWSVFHWGLGLAFLLLFVLHIVLGRMTNPHRHSTRHEH